MAKLHETPAGGVGVSALRRRRLNKAERRQAERVKSQLGKAAAALPLISSAIGGLALSGSALHTALIAFGALVAGGKSLWNSDAAQELWPRIVRDEAPAKSFSASPRARALLRGKEIAAKDLAESGGSYTLEDVRSLLNSVSRQSVEKRVREGRLIAVTGPNNKRFYPVAQFHDDGSVVEGLSEVQSALSTRNGYAVLNFLVNPDPRLDGRRPVDLLKRGEVGRVVEAAARVGEQGA